MCDCWRKYNGALIPLQPPNVPVKDNHEVIFSLIKKQNAYFARWVSDFDCKDKKEFWYIVNNKNMYLDDYSSNTRNQIKKGLKNFNIEKISHKLYYQQLYEIYCDVIKNYNSDFLFKDINDFISNISDSCEFWGVFYKDKLIGYSQNRVSHNFCDYSTIKISKKYTKMYANYALIYEMNRYYLKDRKINYVSDGARSILHDSKIQEFLVKKFKFRKAYCHLHIIYSTPVRFIIFVLFPFRFLIFKLNYFSLFKKIIAILKQEEIFQLQKSE